MADHPEADHVSSAMDYKEHEATYRGFLNLTKWSIAILAVLLIVLYFIVQP
jgi:hypothetical protein